MSDEAGLAAAEETSPHADVEARACVHELPTLFEAHGLGLNTTLTDMLHEHFSHRTERRGCGYTQATRHLAALINRPRSESTATIARLFPAWARARGYTLASEDGLHTEAATPGLPDGDDRALALQRSLRTLIPLLEREESRMLAAIMADLVLPAPERPESEELPSFFGELKVGTCPLAEKYFLEISDGYVRRKGRINVLVSEAGEPLLIEKLNLGDNHSCISLVELVLNGVRLPAGCLFAVQRGDDVASRPTRVLPGSVITIRSCGGFRLLRLTTLAVSPQHRARAFTTHFQSQVAAGLFAPAQVTIDQLRRVAKEQL